MTVGWFYFFDKLNNGMENINLDFWGEIKEKSNIFYQVNSILFLKLKINVDASCFLLDKKVKNTWNEIKLHKHNMKLIHFSPEIYKIFSYEFIEKQNEEK